jgi:hypothetical protein
MAKTTQQCFANAFIDLTCYVACPLSLHPVIDALGKTKVREDGKKLYPSMAVNLPGTINNVRFVANAAQIIKGTKLVVDVTYDDTAEIRFYETTSGNEQMSIPGAEIDFATLRPFVAKVNVPETGDVTDAKPEELEVLRVYKERQDARLAKNLAASEPAQTIDQATLTPEQSSLA